MPKKSFHTVKQNLGELMLVIGILVAGAFGVKPVTGGEVVPVAAAAQTGPATEKRQSEADTKVPGVTVRARVEQSLQHAVEAAQKIEDNQKKVQALVAAARVQIKAGNSNAAEITLRDAVHVAEGMEEQSPQYMALMLITQAEVARGDVPAALKLVEKIEAVRRRPSLLVHIVRAQAETGDAEGALKTAEKIESWEKSNGLTAITTFQAKAGDLPGALRTADLLKDQPLGRGFALEKIAVAQAKAGKRELAKQSLKEARRLILSVIAPQGKSNVMAEFAIYQAEIGDIQGGLQTLEALKLDDDKTFQGSKGYIYWRFAVAQVNAGDNGGAVKFAEGLKNAEERISPLVQIAKTQAALGQREAARATLEKAKQHIDNLADADAKQHHLASLAEVLSNAGDIPTALKTVVRVKESISRGLGLVHIAHAQAELKDRAGALATLKLAVQACAPDEQNPRALHLQYYLARVVCKGLASLGAEREARALAAGQTDPFKRAFAWIGVAEGLESRPPLKEPAFQSKVPKYGLFVFGQNPSKKIWLILDGDNLYADRNGSGDLTETGQKKRAVGTFEGGEGKVFEFGNLTQIKGKKVHLTVVHMQNKDESDKAYLTVGGKDFQTVITQNHPFKFANRPEDAPVIHCAGPLRMALHHETVMAPGSEQDFAVMIGTPIRGGDGFVAVTTNWVPTDIHPVAEFEFSNRQPGGKPIKISCQLNQRC